MQGVEENAVAAAAPYVDFCQVDLTIGRCQVSLTIVRNTVRERRLERGLSQAELAGITGVSRQTINSIETGKYIPSLPLALTLARYFESPVEEIFDADS